MPEASPETLPIVLVAGLNCSPRLYAEQIPALWQFGPVTVADHRRDDTMAAIARRILAAAPPRFALAGLSMGGYIALEIMRQAPARVAKLALLDTGARGETPEQTERRKPLIALAKSGRFAEILESQFPTLVHRSRHNDAALKATVRAMNEETGAEAYLRQQQAIMTRVGFASRPRARSTVRRWFWSATATRRRRRTWRARWPRRFPAQSSSSFRSAGICRRSSGRRR